MKKVSKIAWMLKMTRCKCKNPIYEPNSLRKLLKTPDQSPKKMLYTHASIRSMLRKILSIFVARSNSVNSE